MHLVKKGPPKQQHTNIVISGPQVNCSTFNTELTAVREAKDHLTTELAQERQRRADLEEENNTKTSLLNNATQHIAELELNISSSVSNCTTVISELQVNCSTLNKELVAVREAKDHLITELAQERRIRADLEKENNTKTSLLNNAMQHIAELEFNISSTVINYTTVISELQVNYSTFNTELIAVREAKDHLTTELAQERQRRADLEEENNAKTSLLNDATQHIAELELNISSRSGQSSCTTPVAGNYLTVGSAGIGFQPCPAGYFSATVINSDVASAAGPPSFGCTATSAGSYATGPGATKSILCSPGTYSSTPGQPNCVLAPAGSYVNFLGAIKPTLCALGTYSGNAGHVACDLAPAGHYVSSSGAMVAVKCSPGSYTDKPGQSVCAPAPAGYYVSQPGADAAMPCAKGTYAATPGHITCVLAPVGSFVNSIGAAGPTSCPVGTHNDKPGQFTCIETLINLTNATHFVPKLLRFSNRVPALTEASHPSAKTFPDMQVGCPIDAGNSPSFFLKATHGALVVWENFGLLKYTCTEIVPICNSMMESAVSFANTTCPVQLIASTKCGKDLISHQNEVGWAMWTVGRAALISHGAGFEHMLRYASVVTLDLLVDDLQPEIPSFFSCAPFALFNGVIGTLAAWPLGLAGMSVNGALQLGISELSCVAHNHVKQNLGWHPYVPDAAAAVIAVATVFELGAAAFGGPMIAGLASLSFVVSVDQLSRFALSLCEQNADLPLQIEPSDVGLSGAQNLS